MANAFNAINLNPVLIHIDLSTKWWDTENPSLLHHIQYVNH